MAVDWNAKGMLKWRDEAVKGQQEYFKLLGTPMWREFEKSQYCELKRQIGFALFGAPEEVPHANRNDDTGYTNGKLKEINNIFAIIQKCTKNNKNSNILVSFLFVVGKSNDVCIKIPVIRIQQFDIVFRQNISVFIDPCGRVYKNWQDYLDNNTIPECVLCYPRNGVYTAVNGAVEVEFGITPAGRQGSKVLQGLDVGGTAINVGATGILTAGLFVPVAWPVVAGALGVSMLTGAYATARNVQTLVDRDQHQQSIGLDNLESLNCWLGIGGFVVSVSTMAAAAKTAQADTPLPLAGKIALKSAAIGSCVLNGLTTGAVLGNIIVKAVNGENITTLDIVQLTSAVLFFTHSVISTRQAISLIKNVGRNSSGESSVDLGVLMNRISELRGSINPSISYVLTIVGSGIAVLNTAIKVYPILIDVTGRLWSGRTTMPNFMKDVGKLLGQLWESLKEEIPEVIDIICRAIGVKNLSELVPKVCGFIESSHIREMAAILIEEKSSLLDCGNTAKSSHQRRAISKNSAVVGTDDGPNNVVDGETKNYEPYYDEIANIFAKFVDRQRCRNPEDFGKYMRFVCKFVKDEFRKTKSKYEKAWEMVSRFNPDANIEDFTREYGISGNPNNHFFQEVFNEFNSEEQDVFTSLHLAYEKQNAGTSAQQKEKGQGSLEVGAVRFNTFYSMCGLASNGMLSEQQYREVAAKLMGRSADTDSIYISATGDAAVIKVNDAKDVIMVQCYREDGKVSGIAALL